MSWFVETLSGHNGEWIRCNEEGKPDVHSGRPTEFYDLAKAQEFFDWLGKEKLQGVIGIRIVEPVIGVTGWKVVQNIGRTRWL